MVDSFGVDLILKSLEKMVPEQDADVVISTVHKAKGREWTTVKIAQDFPLEDPQEPLSDEVWIIFYVAITRAKEILDISECKTLLDLQAN